MVIFFALSGFLVGGKALSDLLNHLSITSMTLPTPRGSADWLAGWRKRLAHCSLLVIAPNARRGEIMRRELDIAPNRLRTVWNTPGRTELPDLALETTRAGEPLTLYYHGSINPDRLPTTVIDAMRRLRGRVKLLIAGYDAAAARGYAARLVELGQQGEFAPLVEYAGEIPFREDLLARAAQGHVGLSLMPKESGDVNMRHMAGASNKTFDYMAAGLALLVSDLPEWEDMFVAEGFGRACDPISVDSIYAQLAWFVDHPADRQRMGASGRRKIETEWNYQACFGPILEGIREACV